MLLKKVHKRVAMEVLGFSQESMLKRYQDVVDEMKRDAADVVADALWGPDKKPKKSKKKAGKEKHRQAKDPDSSTDQATGPTAEIIPLRRRAV